MRIIYISKSRYYEESISNNLKDLSESDSILFFYTYHDAENYINNNIIKNKIPVDLIITENNIGNKKGYEFLKKIALDKERTYSKRDFNFSEIPAILIVAENENKNAFLNYGFSDVVDNIGIEKLHLFVDRFRSCVKSWRRKVVDELDNLGIKFNSGAVDYTYYFAKERKKKADTRIISENFKRFPRVLEYDWLTANENQIEIAIDKYIKELKKASRLNNKKDEKAFHRLFNKYPFLIKRDNYDKHWYQPKLYYNRRKYWEPDYSLKPNFNQKTDLSILEVKLPNEGFIKKKSFHPSPYNNIVDHIFQVNDYKDYLESDEYYSAIKRAFGFVPDSVEYNILIGRLDDKTSGFRVFNKRMKQINASHINFITYDELLQYQVRFLDRTKLLTIS